MKKFNTIKEFMDYAPKCLFCGSDNNIIIISNGLKLSRTLSKGITSHKVSGQPLYRVDISKPLYTTYYYYSRIENNKMVISCMEKFFIDQHTPQHYDVMSINMDDSSVELEKSITIGILNSFVRIDFKFLSFCSSLECMGHIYTSKGIIAGGKSKKLMPFLLSEECMIQKESGGDDIIYTLRSDYFNQQSFLSKEVVVSEYLNPKFGLLSDSNSHGTQLPLIDLSFIKNKESFQNRVESYVTFS